MCANYKLVRVYILNWIIYQRPKRNVLYNKCVDIFIRKGYTLHTQRLQQVQIYAYNSQQIEFEP